MVDPGEHHGNNKDFGYCVFNSYAATKPANINVPAETITVTTTPNQAFVGASNVATVTD